MDTDDYMNWVSTHRDTIDAPLPTSEVFGPTIQGEGPHMGRPCHFIRLGGCNLSCTWCDTPYSTGQHGIPLSTIPRHSAATIVKDIPRNTLIIITGGEPLMHLNRPGFLGLLHLLKAKGCEIHVETNGTILPGPDTEHLIDHITVSPKLGVTMANPRHTPSLQSWHTLAHKTIFKFVVERTNDYTQPIQEGLNTATRAGIPHDHVWFMPEGTETDQLQAHWADVAQAAADHNTNATHRLHTLAWGNTKGH